MNPKELGAEQTVEKNNKSGLKNGVQQVFVLPPNLLKKLGINLGNVGTNHMQRVCDLEETKLSETNIDTNTGYNISSNTSKIATTDSYDESSIIKTASLMKQSVFLSPTFSTSGNCTLSPKLNTEGRKDNTIEVIGKCNTDKIENNHAHNLQVLATTFEQNEKPEEEIHNQLHEKSKNCSNNENVCTNNKNILVTHEPTLKSRLSNDTKNTINIISEETLTLSKLNELKACIPSKKALVPTSLNTLIVKKVRNNIQSQTLLVPNSDDNTLSSTTIQLNNPKKDLIINNDIAKAIPTGTCLYQSDEENGTFSNKCVSIAETISDSERNRNNRYIINTNDNETKQSISAQLDCKNKDIKKDSELLLADEIDPKNVYERKLISDSATLSDIEIDGKNCDWNETDIGTAKAISGVYDESVTLPKDNIVEQNKDQKLKSDILNKTLKENENSIASLENYPVSHNNLPYKININNNNFDANEPSKKKIKVITGTWADFDYLKVKHKSETALLEGLKSDVPNSPPRIGSTRACQQSSQFDKIISDCISNNISNDVVLEKPMFKSVNTYVVKRPLKSVEVTKTTLLNNIENDALKVPHQVQENAISLTKYQAIAPNVDSVNIINNPVGSNEFDKGILKYTVETDIAIDLPKVKGKECILAGFISPQESMINLVEDYANISESMDEHNCGIQEFSTQKVTTKKENYLANDLKSGQKSSPPYVDSDQNVNNELKMPANSKRNMFTSKLCIQGVEKPGGFHLNENQNNIKIRTYSNNRKNNLYEKRASSFNDVVNVKADFENTSIDLLPNPSASLTYLQKFCICQDFGILDCDLLYDTYEHVHFLERRILDCSSDILFSMYFDDESLNCKDSVVEKLNNDSDICNEVDLDYICWNNADSIYNSLIPTCKEELKDSFNTQIKKPELDICKLNLNRVQAVQQGNNVSNMKLNIEDNVKVNENSDANFETDTSDNLENESRKRKISNCEDNDDLPEPKKLEISVKCSVCEKDIAETQLEQHIAQHGIMYLKENCNDEIDKGNNNIQIDVNWMTENDKLVKCGVCKFDVIDSSWSTHIASAHNYLAWKDGENPINLKDEGDVKDHLQRIVQELGPLVCSKCGLVWKYAKPYLQHIKRCCGISTDFNTSLVLKKKLVECAVCHTKVDNSLWLEHIAKQHNYLAWKVNEEAVDFNDYKQLRKHFGKVLNDVGTLVCAKCGFERQYAKAFISHLETCSENFKIQNSTLNESVDLVKDADSKEIIKCGVCDEEMVSDKWITHIKDQHNYKAWKEGESPLDFESDTTFRNHLYNIVQMYGPLECIKCGKTRKYVKMYLQHIKTCTGPEHNETVAAAYDDSDSILDIPSAGETVIDGTRSVTCGVCSIEMKAEEWLEHIQKKHNYLAWQVGRKALDLQDDQLVRSYLFDVVHKLGALICGNCGISRKYVKMYLQHVESCTESKGSQMNSTDAITSEHSKQSDDIDNSKDISSMDATDSVLDDSNVNTLRIDDKDKLSAQDAEAATVKCAVCEQEVTPGAWIAHVQKEHNYQAWKDGEEPLNLQDAEAVKKYLNNIMEEVGQLACTKCNAPLKDVELYLQHVSTCTKSEEIITCGVCGKEMKESGWIQHISVNHEYIAWKTTENPIDVNNYEAVWQQLMKIIKDEGRLRCAECGLKRKYPKSYLLHVKACYGKTYVTSDGGNSSLNESRISNADTSLDTTINEDDGDGKRAVKCGVCSEETEARLWLEHAQKQHTYIAWQEGDTPINLEEEQSIIEHLRGIERKYGSLVCIKCGLVRRKATVFYRHIKTCNGPEPENGSRKPKFEHKWANPCGETVKCAMCEREMKDSEWMTHIAKDHDYLAWREGETPLNVNDDASVREHLNMIVQFSEKLICSKCGEGRKYSKSYLQHLKTCTGAEETMNDSSAPKESSGAAIKCGVCRLEMVDNLWLDHIKEHNYIAWQENQQPLAFESEEAIKDYLSTSILQKTGQLICKKCGLVRKYAKPFLQHIEQCQKITWQMINTCNVKVKKERGDIVRCAVCQEELDDQDWVSHIAEKHGYLAWRDRDTPLDLEDEDAVRTHLKNIIQEEGYLQCNKCGLQRKYPKVFLQHVKNCDGVIQENDEEEGSTCEGAVFDDIEQGVSDVKTVVCGVCKRDVRRAQWLEHIRQEHRYLAWPEGKQPIDTNDKDAVYNYLYAISNKYNGLVCDLCGLVRKYVKSYLSHISSCTAKKYHTSDETLECGVCGEKVVGKSWREHAMENHYNIAWVEGETPIDIRTYCAVDKNLREYADYKHKMVCNNCGISRTSHAGFYAHILTCGKSDEEVDNLKDLCEICNQKFLCIYKAQHYRTHRAQELALERKILADKKKAEENQDTTEFMGPRRAAEKARSVIIDYATKSRAINPFKCESCGLESDSKQEIAKHYCPKRPIKEDGEESDISIKVEDESTSESEDTDIDSDLSNEDSDSLETSRRKPKESLFNSSSLSSKYLSKTSKLPFTVRDSKRYMQEAAKDYFEMVETTETLFPQWLDCTHELLPKEMVPQYMPPLEESCKLKMGFGSWTTFKTFEARKELGYIAVFTGGCLQSVAWAPARAAASPRCPSVLAAAAHRAADCPRLPPAHTPARPALLQMWDFGDFTKAPIFAFGLVHDYGIVWGLDWCPSGAREELKEDTESSGGAPLRLGLMAMACSNGSAYVVSVPYPDKSQYGNINFYKIKPCVELRRSRGAIKYQATCINWVMEKGYSTIRVGYGDGTTCLYDLVTESPMLKTKEGDVTILYPFHDERVHNSCVTGVTSSAQGLWSSASPTGCAGALRAGARALRVHAPVAAAAGAFTPHWPSVLLSGDDTIVGHSASELEWAFAGRRVGAVRAVASCGRRARAVAATPPLLISMRPHPVFAQGHNTLNKKAIGLLDIKPLATKRCKHSNDRLSMKVEPLTYEEAIQMYGIEYRLEKDLDKSSVRKHLSKLHDPYPERFPLADVPAIAFCSSKQYSNKIAVATHAGFIFIHS